MKKIVKFLTLCLAILMVVSVFTACGTTSPDTQSATPETASPVTESATPSGEAVSEGAVVIWDYFQSESQIEMMQKLFNDFEASQNQFTAERVYVPFADFGKQLTLGMASGELPDLVIIDGCEMAAYITMGLFGEINDANIKWDEYIEGPMSSTMMDGNHYGIPFATNCTALFYNKTMFDAAGLNYPDENTTWAEFREMANTLTKDGVYGFGNSAVGTDEGTFQCLQWLYTAGGSYTNIVGGVAAYELMQGMIEEGSWTKEVVNWTQTDVHNNFMARNLAMQQNGPWQLPSLAKDAPDLDYGVAVLPKFDENSGQAYSILGGENMGAVKKDDMSGAIAFIEFYNQTNVMVEAMKLYGSFPPKKEAAQDPFWTNDPIQAVFIKQLETSIPRGPSAKWPSYSTVIQRGFQEAMTSAKTPEQAAADTQAAVDAVE